MTDNFNLLKPFLDFSDPSKFYYIQLLARKKDNPDGKSAKNVKDYYVSNLEYLDVHENQIKQLCEFFNARAYIRMSRRSWEDVAFEMNSQMADILKNKQYQFSRKIFSKACGRTQSEDKKRWVVDIDRENFQTEEDFLDGVKAAKYKILELQREMKNTEYNVLTEIPTPNGTHILTEPFNAKKFGEHFLYFDLKDIKKNNPTILFAP